MASTSSRGSEVLLSVVSSPFVKSVSIFAGDKAFLTQYYKETKSVYSAVVAKGRETRIDDEELLRASRILVRLMAMVGKAVKSRYYSFTGTLVLGDELVFRPYVSPTSTARVRIRGHNILVDAGEALRKKIKTKTDIEAAVRRILELLRDETRLDDR